MMEVIKTIFTNQSPGPSGFSSNFFNTVPELMPILLKLIHGLKTRGTFPTLFMRSV